MNDLKIYIDAAYAVAYGNYLLAKDGGYPESVVAYWKGCSDTLKKLCDRLKEGRGA